MQSWGSLLHTIRAPLGVLTGTLIVLLLAPETRDMLAELWGEGTGAWRLNAIVMNLTLLLLGFSAWHWSRAALSAHVQLPDTPDARQQAAAQTLVLNWLPRLMFVTAGLVSLAIAWRNGILTHAALAGSWLSHLVIVLVWLVVFMFLVLRVHGWPRALGGGDRTLAGRGAGAAPAWVGRRHQALRRLLSYAPCGPHAAAVLLGLALLLFMAGAAGGLLPVEGWQAWVPLFIGRLLPGPGAAVLGLALAIGPLTWATFWAQSLSGKVRAFGNVLFHVRWLPVLAIGALLVWEVPIRFDLHAVRVVPPGSSMDPDKRPNLQTMLDDWADACPGEGPLRPVIVAVSGGASRAAVWGARVISEADKQARAAHTGVFAVSSVSGGSLGAAAYLAWLRGMPAGQSPCAPLPQATLDGQATLMKDALGADALGPLLAGALFGDIPRALAGSVLIPARLFTKRFTGLPRGGDRAGALERAFEHNWSKALTDYTPGGPFTKITFDQPYFALSTQGATPLWIANGTDQQNGERLLTVPFKTVAKPIGDWPFEGAKDVLAAMHTDMPISSVIDNTCRFPLLSPVGELAPVGHTDDPAAKHGMQIIDGGYFENEGLQTAAELAGWMDGKKAGRVTPRIVRPILVQATADADGLPGAMDSKIPRCTGAFADAPEKGIGKPRGDQISAPLAGVYGVRAGHTGVVLRQVLNTYCATPEGQRFFNFYLYKKVGGADGKGIDVPLNWTLSTDMTSYIWDHAIGDNDDAHDYPLNSKEATLLHEALNRPAQTTQKTKCVSP